MTTLVVGLDPLAALRELGGARDPDPVVAAALAELAGAGGVRVTCGRERGGIRERDVRLLREVVRTALLLRMPPLDEHLKLALAVRPDVVTLIPGERERLGAERGLDVEDRRAELLPFIQALAESGTLTSILVDPVPNQVKAAQRAGAGAVLLEEYEFARRRGAEILGEVIGFTCNNNGGDLILPNMRGIGETLRLGLQDASLNPDQVDFISAHATGTKMGDIIEAQAIHAVYGAHPLVTGFKGYMGHTMGSCGAIETILILYMMREGFVAPTLNLEEPDERCAMIRHTPGIVAQRIDTAAVQNFAFGGVNTSLLIRRFS